MLNFLIIDDVHADFLLLKRHLQHHHIDANCTWADNSNTLQTLLTQADIPPWDLVFSDYSLPDITFREVLKTVHAHCPDVPVILVSGSVGEEEAVELLKIGLCDFVLKDNLSRLASSINRSLEESANRKALRERENKYQKVIATSSDGFWIIDIQGNILEVNDTYVERSGYSRTELLTMNIRALEAPEQEQETAEHLEKIIKNGKDLFVTYHCTKDGTLWPAEISATYTETPETAIFAFIRDITQRKETEERLEFLAYHDSLTALPNRVLLFDRLEHVIDVARREKRQIALLMLDLDRFKDVNDSFGHLAGDQLLQHVAESLTLLLRDVDTISRLGGDEFTILLENIAEVEDAARVAKRIITSLSKPWQLSQIVQVRIGVTIGISLFPQHGDTPEALLQQADTALYHAKNEGRGCYAYFTEALTHVARDRLDLEARLNKAIEKNELRVYYQPQVDIASNLIVGAEALVRWQDPESGLIAPDRFIPIAEATGLIVALGAWVLRETCRQGKQWLDEGLPALSLSVNVSPLQFRQDNISLLVATVLSETDYPATSLALEMTESSLMQHQQKVITLLNNLRAQGIHLAIDDFGTGYSSLACLKRFPLDVLKIDKSFIEDPATHQNDMEITATIIAMGHTLGFKLLAEGVETEAQLAFLKAKGCDFYQGYLKSRPLPAADFAKLLQQQQRTRAPNAA